MEDRRGDRVVRIAADGEDAMSVTSRLDDSVPRRHLRAELRRGLRNPHTRTIPVRRRGDRSGDECGEVFRRLVGIEAWTLAETRLRLNPIDTKRAPVFPLNVP